MFYFLTAY